MARPGTCSFCGDDTKMTREHVFGNWLNRIGLEVLPAGYRVGPLNQVGRILGGVRPPFQQTVRSVCADCNNGWMSQLETIAQDVLSPFILGEPGSIDLGSLGPIAAWVQKSGLVGMLVLSDAERSSGHGLPESEYRELYVLQSEFRPLAASQLWIGQYSGTARIASIRVVPLVVSFTGLPAPPDRPHGYLTTIVLGQLLLQGVRFTSPSLQLDLVSGRQMAQLWPPHGPVDWPAGEPVPDEALPAITNGEELRVPEEDIVVQPWRPATDLPDSRAVGGLIELPTACGRHVAYYPQQLVREALAGRYYSFEVSCDCPLAYLIQTEHDGAHCREIATPEEIRDLYESLPGDDYLIGHAGGSFRFKRRAVGPPTAPAPSGGPMSWQ